jgi:hypothetical protein
MGGMEHNFYKLEACCDAYTIAFKYKQYDCVYELIKHNIKRPKNFENEIIKSGQLDLVRLVYHKYNTTEYTFMNALICSDIEIAKYLYSLLLNKQISPHVIWFNVIHAKRLDIIEYLHGELRIKLTDELMQSACLMKCWDIVEYLISNMCPIHIFNYDKLQLDNPDLASKVNPATIIP